MKTNRAKRKATGLILLMLVVLACTLAGCGGSEDSGAVSAVDQLKDPGRRIGVAADTNEGQLVEQMFPQAVVEYYKEDMGPFTAVSQGKLDAFIFDKLSMQIAIRSGLTGVRLLEETLGEGNKGAVALSPKTEIPDLKGKLNAFLKEARADGTIEEMEERWFEKSDGTMPDITLPETSDTHLVVGTSGINMPFTYYIGQELAGYDVELATRFAAWLGATLEFKVYDYDGIVAAALSGDVDCVFANLFVTPERAETIDFSDPTYIGEIGVMVRDEQTAPAAADGTGTARPKVEDCAKSRIAVMTGTNFPEIITKDMPNAEQKFFNTVADMLSAIESDKVDAIALDEPVARNLAAESREVEIAEGYLEEFDFAYLFPKTPDGEKLCAEVSEYIREKKEDGTLLDLQEKWFDGLPSESMMSVDPNSLPDTNGTIRLASIQYPPFEIVGENMFFGYEIELISLFARDRGYSLNITETNADATIPFVMSGKADMGAAAAAITQERQESVLFSEPSYSGGVVLAVRKTGDGAELSFIDSFKESFEKTFIRENRYMLFLSGIGMTLLIVVLSAVLGTGLGFLLFLACRRGNRFANRFAKTFAWLITGMPIVVLLMILYYIIFANVSISGAAVAVIGFTLVFGAEIYGAVKSAVGAVDGGQMEAALALGYSDRRAFFRCILPQALPHFLPGYRGSLTALIKATAVVGYIAVQDLTKMGDIVRSRTYEAFFPLIAVAVIYFILAGILIFVVNRLTLRIDPTRRKKEEILQGIRTSY